MATINDVYTHLKTLTKKWFYEKTEIDTKLSNKVDKETGKGLSTEDYTSAEKTKLTNIENEANKTTVDTALSDSSSNPVRNSAVTTAINGKAPTSHASSSSTYGLGTTSNYGHVKTINGLTQSSHQNGTALSAYQGKILNDAINNKVDKITGKGLSTNDFTDTYKNKIDQLGEELGSINLDWDSITQKPSSYPPTTHQHDVSDVLENDDSDYHYLTVSNGATQHDINLDIDDALYTLDGNIANISTDWDDIENKPTNFTPSAHTHGLLQNDGKITNVSSPAFDASAKPLVRDMYGNLNITTFLTSWLVHNSALPNLGLQTGSTRNQKELNEAIDTALGNKISKSQTVGLVKNDGSIDTSTYLTQHQDITGKANQSDLTALTSRVSALETSEFQIVFKSSKNALPATGRANTLYYVANSGSGENTYDEYTWIAADSKYELVGSKEIDLSGYVQKTNLITEIDTIIQSLNAIQE